MSQPSQRDDNQRVYTPFAGFDNVREFLFRFAAKGIVPYRWFNKNLPAKNALSKCSLPLKLEIVSHCWNYSDFLTYQLSSLITYPFEGLSVTHTVFYCHEDLATTELLAFFEAQQTDNVTWNFINLPKEQLFRRAIGRNMAAKQSSADWVWFTDCDVVFHEGALTALAKALAGRQDVLVYPQTLRVTELLSKDDDMLAQVKQAPGVREVDTQKFSERNFTRATGPIQIVHGDVARACGYCDDVEVYQKTMPRWAKCYDDRCFRWLINSKGVPIDVPNVLFIRHAEKGRYQQGSQISFIRKSIRRAKSSLIGR